MPEELHGYRLLKTGNLSFLYRQGEIRRICMGDIQVINAIYGAVRDKNWGTVPARLSHESIKKDGNAVRVDVGLLYEESEIEYKAEIRIQVEPQKLSFHYRGTALSSFLRNRIGICVLHPIYGCKGQALKIHHPDGSISETSFPEQISPDQPGLNITGMQWKAAGAVDAELHFHGELFETEDQRNWTDASFKTYSTPLEIPFPVEVQSGEDIEQSVDLIIGSNTVDLKAGKDQGIKVTVHRDRICPIPHIGVGSTRDTDPLSKEEAALLKRIPFNHIRADLSLGYPIWVQQFDRTLAEQDLLEWPVELGLHFSQDYREEIKSFLQLQGRKGLQLANIMIFDRQHMTGTGLLEQVLPGLRETFPNTPVGGGTNAYFAELNRSGLEAGDLDFVSYSICPQVHSLDNLSLLENLEAQGDTVGSARLLFQKPVHIGALSLKQRFNFVATDESDESDPYPLSDLRQGTVYAAGWTLGSIRQLARAGADSLTYFESVGVRGLMDRQRNSSKIYPLYYALEEILRGYYQIFDVSCSDPLSVEAIALQKDRETTLLMVNLTEIEQQVELDVRELQEAKSYILDEHSWNLVPNANLQEFYLKAASMYKIILRS